MFHSVIIPTDSNYGLDLPQLPRLQTTHVMGQLINHLKGGGEVNWTQKRLTVSAGIATNI